MTDLSFRLATALFGHAGIEWDITQCDDAERSTIRAWAALYVELRPLLHGGETVRTDLTDDGTIVHGVVAPGAVLIRAGIPMPSLHPAQALILELTGVP